MDKKTPQREGPQVRKSILGRPDRPPPHCRDGYRGCLSSALNSEEESLGRELYVMRERFKVFPETCYLGSHEEHSGAGGNHASSTTHLRQCGLFSRRVFHSKEVRVLASDPLVVSGGCGQVPGTARPLEAPWLRKKQ